LPRAPVRAAFAVVADDFREVATASFGPGVCISVAGRSLIVFQSRPLLMIYLVLWVLLLVVEPLLVIRRRSKVGRAPEDRGFRALASFVFVTSNLAAIVCLRLFRDLVSALVLLVPFGALMLRRMRIEEAALSGALGDAYSSYTNRTKRLIPGIY
jgi:protein-S-isoprenylcysteine O-methyltransferase Ste14